MLNEADFYKAQCEELKRQQREMQEAKCQTALDRLERLHTLVLEVKASQAATELNLAELNRDTKQVREIVLGTPDDPLCGVTMRLYEIEQRQEMNKAQADALKEAQKSNVGMLKASILAAIFGLAWNIVLHAIKRVWP